MKQAEHSAQEVIAQAQKQARAMIAEAEITGQKRIQEYAHVGTQTEATYEETMKAYRGELSSKLDEVSKESMQTLQTLTASVTQSVQKQQETMSAEFTASVQEVQRVTEQLGAGVQETIADMQHRVTKMGDELATHMEQENTDAKKYIDEHLHEAAKAAEEQIAAYQKARVALLDTHIERLVEDVTARVLQKELSLSQHAELAELALQEAKEHNLL